MGTTLYSIAGSSGVGKSTLVLFFHEFLKYAGYEVEDYNCSLTGEMIGYYCKDLNLVYLGEDNVRTGKNSVMKWQGIDNIARSRIAPSTAEQFEEIYRILNEHDVIMESMMHSVLPPVRPKRVEEAVPNATKVVVLNYMYRDYDQRDERTARRRALKGIAPRPRNGWLNSGGEKLFHKDPSDKVALDYTWKYVDEQNIWDLALKVFIEKGMPEMESKMREFAETINPKTFNLNYNCRSKKRIEFKEEE